MSDFVVEIEKQFDKLGKGIQDVVDRLSNEATSFQPRWDVFQSKNDVQLFVDLPGIEKDDVSVSVKDGVLILKGQRKLSPPENTQVLRNERKEGAFYRSIALPEIADTASIKASFKAGCLHIMIPLKDGEANEITIE